MNIKEIKQFPSLAIPVKQGKHKCTVCGMRSDWNDSWQWYGAIDDDGMPIIKTCSDKCRSEISDPERLLLKIRRES
jgi:hypothetical protein